MPIGPHSPPSYRFDGFQVNLRRGVLQERDGQEVRLRPRSFELLLFLLDHPQELLTRETLLEALWPGLAVTDDSLTQCVSELRHAFGERGPALLRTVPRRGYMLAAEVRREAELEAAPSARTGEPSIAGVAPDRDALIVSPVEVAVDGSEGQRLGQVLRAEILAATTTFEIVRVLVHADHPPPGSYVLSPSVLEAGDSVLISLRLERVEDGHVLWAERALVPPHGSWRSVVERLMNQVSLELNASSLQRARRMAPEELGPRELILLGREAHQRGGEANTLAAQRLFLRAIALAPDAAVAHSYYALTMLRHITHGWGNKDWAAERELVLKTAQHAVALEPRSALCLATLSFALLQLERWEEAVETSRRALTLSTVAAIDTRTICAEVLAAAGEGAEGVAALEPSIALNPFCPPRSRAVLGRALLMAGRTEEALGELHRAAALLGDYAPCLRSIVVAAVELGRWEEAERALQHLERLQPNWVPPSREVMAFFRHRRDLERFLEAFRLCADRRTDVRAV